MQEMRKEMLWLTLIYCAAHLPLLATTGQRYDDWLLFLVDSKLNVQAWTATGRPLTGPFLNAMRDVGGVFLARLCSFFAYLVAGLLLADTLRRLPFVEPSARFMVTAFFMVFPADATRVLPMLAYDSLCYFLFFLGFWLTSRYLELRWLPSRVMALAAFCFSFWLNSLLVMYLVPLCFIASRVWQPSFTVRGALASMARYADFLCLPVFFWLMQRAVFPPSGQYAGYNQLALTGLSPKRWFFALKGALLDPTIQSLLPFHPVQMLAVLGFSCLLFFLWRNRFTITTSESNMDYILLGIGFIAIFLALFPYVMVRKTADYWDWSSRHARLVPLGAGIIVYYGLKVTAEWIKAKGTAVLFACCLLLCVCVSGTIKTYGEYWVDWYKTLALIEQFKSSQVIKDHTSFLFKDDASQFNARSRWFRFYEYAALMETAFGDQRRFGHDEKHWPGPQALDELARLIRRESAGPGGTRYAGFYRLGQWTPKQPEYRVTIVPIRDYPGVWEVLKLKCRELKDQAAFAAAPPALVRLEFHRIDRH